MTTFTDCLTWGLLHKTLRHSVFNHGMYTGAGGSMALDLAKAHTLLDDIKAKTMLIGP